VIATSRNAVYLPYFADLKTVNLRYFADADALYGRLDALASAGAEVFVTDRTLDRMGLLAELASYGLDQTASGDGLTLYRVARQGRPASKTPRARAAARPASSMRESASGAATLRK